MCRLSYQVPSARTSLPHPRTHPGLPARIPVTPIAHEHDAARRPPHARSRSTPLVHTASKKTALGARLHMAQQFRLHDERARLVLLLQRPCVVRVVGIPAVARVRVVVQPFRGAACAPLGVAAHLGCARHSASLVLAVGECGSRKTNRIVPLVLPVDADVVQDDTRRHNRRDVLEPDAQQFQATETPLQQPKCLCTASSASTVRHSKIIIYYLLFIHLFTPHLLHNNTCARVVIVEVVAPRVALALCLRVGGGQPVICGRRCRVRHHTVCTGRTV